MSIIILAPFKVETTNLSELSTLELNDRLTDLDAEGRRNYDDALALRLEYDINNIRAELRTR